MRGRLLLALASLVVFVALAETVTRLANPDLSLPAPAHRFRFDQENHLAGVHHVRDDRLGWRLMPDQRIRVSVGERARAGDDVVLRTNGHGFRGREFEIAKAPGTLRILVVGDSNAMGFGVPSDEAIYSRGIEALLSRHLEPRGLTVEVINMGVDGYSSHQVRLLVDDYVPRLDPDVVCVQVGFNDHCLAPVPDARHSFARPWALDVLERSHAYRWLRRMLLSATGAHERTKEPVPRVSVDAFESNVRAIVETCREEGAELVLLTTPARIGYPLTLNEVPVEVDGETTWTTETAWIDSRLRAAGVVPPDQPASADYLRVVEAALEAHPDWATLHVMRAHALLARGDTVAAEAARSTALEHDTEGDTYERYMARLRTIAEATDGAGLVDVGAALRRAIGGGARPPLGDGSKDYFLDFVHLDERGQIVVATAVAEAILRRLPALTASG